MKKLLILNCCILLFSLSFTSCYTYQYATVSSHLKSDKNGLPYFENDTLLVSFAFTGENCPIDIEVYNKQDKPLYVLWKNSALIVGGKSYPLWTDESSITITTDGVTNYVYDNYFVSNSEGTVTKKEAVSFLPPRTAVTIKKYDLTRDFIELSDSDPFVNTKLNCIGGTSNAKKYSFSQENTPLPFRLFLTFALDEKMDSQFSFDEDFWISEIISTMADPVSFPNNPPNRFHISKVSNFSKAMGYVLLVPAVIISIWAGGAD